jgi:hypothetical protein
MWPAWRHEPDCMRPRECVKSDWTVEFSFLLPFVCWQLVGLQFIRFWLDFGVIFCMRKFYSVKWLQVFCFTLQVDIFQTKITCSDSLFRKVYLTLQFNVSLVSFHKMPAIKLLMTTNTFKNKGCVGDCHIITNCFQKLQFRLSHPKQIGKFLWVRETIVCWSLSSAVFPRNHWNFMARNQNRRQDPSRAFLEWKRGLTDCLLQCFCPFPCKTLTFTLVKKSLCWVFGN